MNFKLLLLTIVFASAAVFAKANNGPGTGEDSRKNDIAGGVIHADTKKPLSNVSVTAYSTVTASHIKKEKIVLTDGNGNYSFNDLKPGTYKLVFEKDGFKKVTKEKITIRSDEEFQLNIELPADEGFQFLPGGLLFSDFD